MKTIRSILSFSLFVAVHFSATMAVAQIKPPVANVIAQPHVFHGEVLEDNYFWLRDEPKDGAPYKAEVLDYVNAENRYTEQMTAEYKPLEDAIFSELKLRATATLSSTQSYERGNYLYFQRQSPGQEYPTYFRKHLKTEKEELLLDVSAMAGAAKYFNVKMGIISPDENFLPFGVDTFGQKSRALYIKNLTTGEVRLVRAKDVYMDGDVAWSSDGRYLFYSVPGTLSRDSRIVRYDLQATDVNTAEVTVFDELDGDFYLYVVNTASRKYIILFSTGGDTSMARVISADRPTEPPVLVSPKKEKFKFQIDHADGRFYFLANLDSVNGQIYSAPENAPTIMFWKKITEQPLMTDVQKMSVFQSHIVAVGVENAFQKLSTIRLSDLKVTQVSFNDPFFTAYPDRNLNSSSVKYRFKYSSYLEAVSMKELDLDTNAVKTLEAISTPGFDAKKYKVERHWATATDGTQIPYNQISRADLLLDGKNPTLVKAYGNYGASMISPYWAEDIVSLLERGVVIIYAYPRGGGEMGAQWGIDGKMGKKINTFTDIIAIGKNLISQNVTSSSRMALEGASAAGLTLGYIANNEPTLFKALLANVPFVDIINTMSDASIPLTTQEYVVWGNPANPIEYAYIRKYSPYDNVSRHEYPAMLMISAMGDSQVPYWEPLKWMARIRANKTDQNLLILRMGLEGGHSGGSGVSGPLREKAFEQTFLLKQIGERH